jgi:hypothetical protein
MKELSLRPYHGKILLCESVAEMKKVYRQKTGRPYPFTDDDPTGGRYIKLDGSDGSVRWLVWGNDFPCVAHELTHVLLHTFGVIGHNPTEGDGEPFCYMLSQLLHEAA